MLLNTHHHIYLFLLLLLLLSKVTLAFARGQVRKVQHNGKRIAHTRPRPVPSANAVLRGKHGRDGFEGLFPC